MDAEKIKVSCGVCGATNAFPAAARGKTVVCGRCKSPLPEPGTVLEPGAEGIDALFHNSSLPVLADFYSPTCAPCHMMAPILERSGRAAGRGGRRHQDQRGEPPGPGPRVRHPGGADLRRRPQGDRAGEDGGGARREQLRALGSQPNVGRPAILRVI